MTSHKFFLTLIVLTFLTPQKNLHCLEQSEAIAYGSIGGVAIAAVVYLAIEHGEKKEDKNRIETVKQHIENYRNAFKNQIEEIETFEDLQAFAQAQQHALNRSRHMHHDAKILLATMKQRSQRNDTPEMLHATSDIQRIYQMATLTALILERAELLENHNEHSLFELAKQKAAPSSSPYPTHFTAQKWLDDIQFLQQDAAQVPAKDMLISRLQTYVNTLHASPHYLDESRIADVAKREQEKINLEKEKVRLEQWHAYAQQAQAEAQQEQARQLKRANDLKEKEIKATEETNKLLAKKLRQEKERLQLEREAQKQNKNTPAKSSSHENTPAPQQAPAQNIPAQCAPPDLNVPVEGVVLSGVPLATYTTTNGYS